MKPIVRSGVLLVTMLAVVLAGCAEPEPLEPAPASPVPGPGLGPGAGNATAPNATAPNATTPGGAGANATAPGGATRSSETRFSGTVGVATAVATSDPANFTQEVQVGPGASTIAVRMNVTGNGTAEFRLVDPAGMVVWAETVQASAEPRQVETVNGGALVSRAGAWSIRAMATEGSASFDGVVAVHHPA